MDQDSFRQLLATPRPGSTSRPSLLPPRIALVASNTSKKGADDKSTFKPRKVTKKPADSRFRDRAAERREGVNEYAQVESILEDFEKRTANETDREAVEVQRRYLGGDSEHSILVKGLDYALLEQNKAREGAAESEELDQALEEAFQQASTSTARAKPPPASSETTQPKAKKRTREHVVAELKRQRIQESQSADTAVPPPSEEVDALERAKKMGKFRPIGAPPPTLAPTGTAKAEKRKKKKRKVEVIAPSDPGTKVSMPPPPPPPASKVVADPMLAPAPAPVAIAVTETISPKAEPPTPPISIPPALVSAPTSALAPIADDDDDDDDDIFADAGEYEGVDFGSDDDADRPGRDTRVQHPNDDDGSSLPKTRWFDDPPSPIAVDPPIEEHPPPTEKENGNATPTPLDDKEEEFAAPMKLAPLSSSALPSIRDLLDMDAQEGAREKKKARKEKNKSKTGGSGGGTGEIKEAAPKTKLGAEAKLNRDYQKINAYMDKKAGGSGA